MDYLSKLIEMLEFKNHSSNTIRTYKTYITAFLSYLDSLGISPEDASWEVVRSFLMSIKTERHLSDRTINVIISQLQFFWIYVLDQQWNASQVPLRRFATYLPYVPDREHVAALLHSLNDPKALLACSLLYATGMRIDELCHLQCSNISLSRKHIYIPVSKNLSDRYIPIPDSICDSIRTYWYDCPKDAKPNKWLFTQQRSIDKPMDKQWLQKIFLDKRTELGFSQKFTAHSLRHAYATHSYENGMDLLTLKENLGHHSINSTAIYLHLAASRRNTIPNPFDQLGDSSYE